MQEFFQKQVLEGSAHFPNSDKDIQELLLSVFRTTASSVDLTSRVLAGLCLRCYVSYPILKACRKLASLFSAGKQFTYCELLPFVLNDDGRTQILLDSDGKTQLILNSKGKTQVASYKIFAVEVLRTYRLNSEHRLSLENWTHYQTRQNQDLIDFLSEWGFRSLSDWALLNKVGLQQLERLSQRDRYIVKAFHAVYRRDRRQQRQNSPTRCPDPTEAQLKEMSHLLQEKGVEIAVPAQLREALRQVAANLHQYEIWSRRGAPPSEPLESFDPDTGDRSPTEVVDENSTNDLGELERTEILEFLQESLIEILDRSIDQALSEQVAAMQQRRKYAPLAAKIVPGFRLLYCQGKSQSEIASLLGMTNQTQVSRLLQVKALFNNVRSLTVDQLFLAISKKIQGLGLADISTQPDNLSNIMQLLEAFVDREVFQEAAAELHTAKTKAMNSVYAQRLCRYLQGYKE
ncbi:MAG TPA: hypothetical protein DDZ80_13990 [Cyanobacteria bacterium UBA8803]|nr:hypothetical protein [Cyanobacteria bacterium UBA9273]HBL59552.1 hypothetical protein [Cyanobacteria bacterium UBA8803]